MSTEYWQFHRDEWMEHIGSIDLDLLGEFLEFLEDKGFYVQKDRLIREFLVMKEEKHAK